MKGYSPQKINKVNSKIQLQQNNSAFLVLGEDQNCECEGGETEIGKGNCICKTKNC